ncbi:3-oxoacyl-[acyl-carrier-protein] reductase [bacterium SCN 62-11]|nr:SDR family oxidoreductase [Candidatus Eremiobacteraeota bacterium]ODT68590.1 MAG: 3-oxoacyl-[acyl-carrier-protein] reductase [bacterium SCN 62-11]
MTRPLLPAGNSRNLAFVKSLKDKVALITGGSSGIGLGTAEVFAREGAHLAILGRSPDHLKTAADKLRKLGAQVLEIQADVSQEHEMKRAISQVEKEWGQLDIVFANAGINGVWAPLEELQPEEWEQTLSINLTGTYHTIRCSLPLLKKNGGSVIITSSVNGTRMFSNTGCTAYACTKAAQVAMAKMLALELASHKIRVNVVCPGWIESDIDEATEKRDLDKIAPAVEFPEGAVPLTQGAPGSAEQVGNVVLFLASDLSSHVTGSEIWVDGAQSLLQG